jgi:hypothetical protein
LLAAGMVWSSASFAGFGAQFALYITVKNTGAGDQVSWNFSNGPDVAAQRTAVLPASSSWLLALQPWQSFETAGGLFSQPVSFHDATRPGYFDIITFTDATHLVLDVRQAASKGTVVQSSFASSSIGGFEQAVILESRGTAYTNPVTVPEPASYAMLMAGLIAAGVTAKRRKATPV